MQQMKENFVQGPFFKPLTSTNATASLQSNEKMRGVDLQNDEAMNVLHKRMYQETDKIRKWKMKTDLELKQKDRQLHEVNQTVESLRKSLLDLQLQNENLSMRLQDEVDNRKEILQKITSTRELCNVLKEYADRVEVKLAECENEKSEFMVSEEKQRTHYEELAEKFQALEISASENCDKLVTALKKSEEDKDQFQTEYQHKLQSAESEMDHLTEEKKRSEANIELLRLEQQNTSSRLCEILDLKVELEKQLLNANESFTIKESEIQQIQADLDAIKKSHIRLEEELQRTSGKLEDSIVNRDKLAKNFDETEKLYITRVESMQTDLIHAQEKIEEYIKIQNQLEDKVYNAEKIIEDLKCAKDMLVLERTEYTSKIKELDIANVKMTEKQEKTENDNTRAIKEMEQENNDLAEEKNNFEMRLIEREKEIISINTKLNEANATNSNLSDIIRDHQNELEETKKELQALTDKEEATTTKLDDLTSQLDNEKDKEETSRQDYKKLVKEKQAVEKEHNLSKKEVNKLTKEIEKILKRETKAKADIEKGQAQLEAIRKELDEDKKVAGVAADNEKDLKEKLKEARKQNTEQEVQIRKLEKAQKAADTLHEHKMKAMIATLDQYKKDGDKIVAVKIKELDESKKKIIELNKKSGDSLSAIETELITANKKLSEAEELLQTKEETIASTEKLVKQTEDQLKTKDKEIDEIAEKIDTIEKEKRELEEKYKLIQDTPEKLKELTEQYKELQQASKVVPVAPCTPQISRPLQDFLTPQNRTPLPTRPNSGILRQSNPLMKKRRVAFAPENEDSDMEDDASSASELGVEIEVDENDPILKTPRSQTPSRSLLIRPSPRANPMKSPMSRVTGTPTTLRAISTPKSTYNKRPKYDSPSAAVAELEKFKELFPGVTTTPKESENKKSKKDVSASAATKNVRTAPKKPPGRIFKNSPKDRKRMLTKKKEEHVAWFDSDAVFGFGPED